MGEILLCSHFSPMGEILLYSSFSGGKFYYGGGKTTLQHRYPCRGRLGTLKTPSCPWRGCPAAGQNLETGHLSRHYIAEISLKVTLNHNQHKLIRDANNFDKNKQTVPKLELNL